MKRYIKSTVLALAALLAPALLASCAGDKAEPPMNVPEGLVRPDGTIGNGTWQSPLTAFQAGLGTSPEGLTGNVWVCGYIVGWVDSSLGATLNQKTAIFQVPASVKSNLLLSWLTPRELEERYVEYDENREVVSDTRWEHCVTVQLVYDTAPRPALNLSEHPEMLGQMVSICGETNVKYFGVYGIKNTYAFNMGDQGVYIKPPVPGVFRKTAAFTPDRTYLIAHGKQVAKALTSSRGYLYMTDVTVSDNTISLSTQANAFYFEQAEKGIRIRQDDGLWFMVDGTDIAMHTTDNPDQAGCYFDVQAEGDGTFTITSKANGGKLMFDTSYTSFGVYTNIAGKEYPELYELVK